ncbi:hypothetical protein V1460_26115 [Streptomyces sp. SCSIO 30461]|uniref:hypothetical protein n=1 Tax=Streptomyces sp. SCSIO 30461 TaxID=3118085 RepID=UPI0030CDDB1C
MATATRTGKDKRSGFAGKVRTWGTAALAASLSAVLSAPGVHAETAPALGIADGVTQPVFSHRVHVPHRPPHRDGRLQDRLAWLGRHPQPSIPDSPERGRRGA